MTQETLRMALDALETELSIDWGNQDEFNASAEKMYEAIAAIKQALAHEQKQEPVAWVSEDVCKGQYIDGRPRKIWWECEKGVGTAFYTTSPQRTWVGLTDEEMEATFIQCGGKWNGDFWKIEDADFHPFLRTIEAKLKEKNT